MRNKISLYVPPFSHIKSYFEMVDVAVKYGIGNVETLNIMDLEKPDLEFARKLRAYADERGVKFTCCSVGVNLVGDDAGEQIELAKKFADIAVILGSPYLHHTIAFDVFNREEVIKNREAYFRLGIKAAREIYDYADKLGVRALYEEQGYVVNGIDGFRRLMTEIDRESGVVADFGNILFADDKIEDFIPEYKDRICNVHIKDYITLPKDSTEELCSNSDSVDGAILSDVDFRSVGGTILRDCPFGEGVVNFEAAFEELKKIGYDGYYATECPPMGEDEEATFKKNIEILNEYIEAMQR